MAAPTTAILDGTGAAQTIVGLAAAGAARANAPTVGLSVEDAAALALASATMTHADAVSILAALSTLATHADAIAPTPTGTNAIGTVSVTGTAATTLATPAVGAAAFATPAAVSVTGTSGAATLLVAARTGAPGTGRVRAILENGAAVQVMICPSAASTTGIPLLGTIGAALTLNTTAAIYAFVASGTGTISVLEEF